MATHPGSIRRHGRGFEVRLCVAGRRHSYTVRCEDRREAQQWAKQKEAELARQAERSGPERLTPVRMSELLDQFERDELPAKAPGTIGRRSSEADEKPPSGDHCIGARTLYRPGMSRFSGIVASGGGGGLGMRSASLGSCFCLQAAARIRIRAVITWMTSRLRASTSRRATARMRHR